MAERIPTLGVEEEFQLLDAETFDLRPGIDEVLPEARRTLTDADVESELQASQVEIGTPVCDTLDDVRRELMRLRRALASAAERRGCRLAATATHPWATADDAELTPKPRYETIGEHYAQLAREQLICGCHVHVCVEDREVAVQALDQARPWLSPLLALAANSPFWRGDDTGYASYRTEIWAAWPTAGPPLPLSSWQEYQSVTDALVASGVVPDHGMLYWDARPSRRYDTLELRVTDVCLSVDDAVLVAGLARALVLTGVRAALAGTPAPQVRHEVVRAAHWRAARSGLSGELVDPRTWRPAPAAEVVGGLLEHVRPALEVTGDEAEIRELAAAVVGRGNGADRQRAAYARRGELKDVLAAVVEATAAG
jgi:carboxylate-amine ligase